MANEPGRGCSWQRQPLQTIKLLKIAIETHQALARHSNPWPPVPRSSCGVCPAQLAADPGGCGVLAMAASSRVSTGQDVACRGLLVQAESEQARWFYEHRPDTRILSAGGIRGAGVLLMAG